MKAFSQRPSPSGSYIAKNKSPVPQLGDGLLTLFMPSAASTKSPTYTTEIEVSATLTSNNLNRLAESAYPDDNIVFTNTSSICSDEDVVLLGASNRSSNSKSSLRLSSRSGTPRGDETPPTTLTGDDSFFSSDGETALGTSLPTSIDRKPFSNPGSVSSTTYGSENDAIRTKHGLPATIPPTSKMALDTETSHFIVHNSIIEPPGLLETTAIHTSNGVAALIEEIPNVASLHGIVRGFLATGPQSKKTPPSIIQPQEPSQLHFIAPNVATKAKPFWEPQRIFEFYLEGAITPDNAKETAKRCGYPDIIQVIDIIERLKKKNPSHPIFDIVATAVSEGDFEVFSHLTGISAVLPLRDQHDAAQQNFMRKLASYSALDGPVECAKPLHVFVDMSNIHIGFCNSWKISQNIPVERRVRAPAFNFKVLASIMERNRAAKKKVLASSVASHVVGRTQWPQHFVDAEKQGYKTNILSRVQKVSPTKAGRRRKTSAQEPAMVRPANVTSSDDESVEDITKVNYGTKNGEQGVDEILHLNMMNSILDDMREPGSMVLATGDAAQAEFSEGFLEYATRALSQGWNLELVTWKSTISSSWVNPNFRSKYGERFRVIYLDEFLGELNADLSPSLT